jgi:tRNA U34 5-methylaminomethyl-2-thiouridine-forming methyltransferase MnmC
MLQIQFTKDNSHTLFAPELDETYHSRNGALEEAMYVYIGRGLLDWIAEGESAVSSPRSAVGESSSSVSLHPPYSNIHPPPSIIHPPPSIIHPPSSTFQHPSPIIQPPPSILEIGFGTGLNAWLTAIECEKLGIPCTYHSLETKPLDWELVKQLNYTQQTSETFQQLFASLHAAPWNVETAINEVFALCKFETALQSFAPTQSYDIIYFDAFAPEKQPELWTEDCFQKLYDCLNPNGIIVTYSSKGDVKRLWKKIGFDVERLPGPPNKRHMLRGRKGWSLVK